MDIKKMNVSEFPLEATVPFAVRFAERVYPIYVLFSDIHEHSRHLRDLEAAIKVARAFALDDKQWENWNSVFDRASFKSGWKQKLDQAMIFAKAAEFAAADSDSFVAQTVSEAVTTALKNLQIHQAVQDANYGGGEFTFRVASGESLIHTRNAAALAFEAVSKYYQAEANHVKRAAEIDHAWVLKAKDTPSLRRQFFDCPLWPEDEPQYWQRTTKKISDGFLIDVPVDHVNKVNQNEADHSKKSKRVFISYAREDYPTAEKIFAELDKKQNISPWLDRMMLKAGDDWKYEIEKEMDECHFAILLLSNKSVSKEGYVQNEVGMALERFENFPPGETFIIPVRIDDCIPRHEKLKHLHWAELYPNFEESLKEIISVIEFKGH